MKTKIINGKSISNKINKQTLKLIKKYTIHNKRKPGLAMIMVGKNDSSTIYIKNKKKICKKMNIFSKNYYLPEKTESKTIIKLIKKLNTNKLIDGILVQLPMPKKINEKNIISKLSVKKDVDCFNQNNLINKFKNKNKLENCTSYAIKTILKKIKKNLNGLNVTIIGNSDFIGKPIAKELIALNMTVTICNKYTKNIKNKIKSADILISAIGHANLIKGSWIKKSSIIIDVGINKTKLKKITGDIEFDIAKKKTSYITPVPGGVGPITIAKLMENTYLLYKTTKNKLKR